MTFVTSENKNNQAYWVKILQLEQHKQNFISAHVDSNNIIKVETKNISKYQLLMNQMNQVAKTKLVTIYTNKKISYQGIYKDNILIGSDDTVSCDLLKNSQIEGPIWDVFSNSFIAVKGTLGKKENNNTYEKYFMEFAENWEFNYFGNCRIKMDREILNSDIWDNNLILFGTENTNLILQKIIKDIPITVTDQYIDLQGNRYYGTELLYAVIYPNPLNHKKYVLIIGANNNKYFPKVATDLFYTGIYDYVVFDISKETKIEGYFDKCWY